MLSEARKFKLSLTVAHQYVGKLPEKVLWGLLGNVGTVAAFRTGAADAGVFESLFTPTFNARDLAFLPNYRALVRSFGCLGDNPFSVELPPPRPEVNPELAGETRKLSRETYGRPREKVEAEIENTSKAFRELGASQEESD